MHVGPQSSVTKTRNKPSILLMDANSERRALRKKIMALHGIEVVGACDLTEATSIWHPDRYDAVLIDTQRDHRGCIAWRDEIKKEKPQQIVVFVVGKPKYIELNPLARSFVSEEQDAQWGDPPAQSYQGKLQLPAAKARPHRNGLAITTAKKLTDGRPKIRSCLSQLRAHRKRPAMRLTTAI